MEAVTTETREHTEVLPTGTQSVTDVVTVETVSDTPAVADVDEGIDETWLEGRFASVRAEISNLSTQVATNQTANLETITRLMELVTSQQTSMTLLLERLSSLTTPQPSIPQPQPIPVEVVNPVEIPNPIGSEGSAAVVASDEPQATPQAVNNGRRRVRKI